MTAPHRRPSLANLRRTGDRRVIGGVAGGLARALNVEPTYIRVAIVVGSALGGIGALVYVGLWLAIPADGESSTLAERIVHSSRHRVTLLVVGIAAGPALLLLRWLVGPFVGGTVIPFGLAAVGVAFVWVAGSDEDREPLARIAGAIPGRRPGGSRHRILRVTGGGALVLTGLVVLGVQASSMAALRGALLGTLAIVGGLALVFGPWAIRIVTELAEERRTLVRTEERAVVASHLHDSVLQTLALIQKAAEDPRRVTTLARRQERELRAWLWGGSGADGEPGATTLGAALQAAADEVEELHGVPVELVTVGDCPMDADLAALVAATREAMVNAAKWSGAPSVAAFVEVEPAAVSAFVRDRGRGFDPASVGGDRRGIADSIVARLGRHGGRGVVRSNPGSGTEVELRLPRRAA